MCGRADMCTGGPGRRAAPGPGVEGVQQRQDRRAQDGASFVWLHFKQRQQQGNRSPPLPFSEDQSEAKNRSQEAFDPNVSNERKHPARFAIRECLRTAASEASQVSPLPVPGRHPQAGTGLGLLAHLQGS